MTCSNLCSMNETFQNTSSPFPYLRINTRKCVLCSRVKTRCISAIEIIILQVKAVNGQFAKNGEMLNAISFFPINFAMFYSVDQHFVLIIWSSRKKERSPFLELQNKTNGKAGHLPDFNKAPSVSSSRRMV